MHKMANVTDWHISYPYTRKFMNLRPHSSPCRVYSRNGFQNMLRPFSSGEYHEENPPTVGSVQKLRLSFNHRRQSYKVDSGIVPMFLMGKLRQRVIKQLAQKLHSFEETGSGFEPRQRDSKTRGHSTVLSTRSPHLVFLNQQTFFFEQFQGYREMEPRNREFLYTPHSPPPVSLIVNVLHYW